MDVRKSPILSIQLLVFDYRRILKSRIYKSWRKNIHDIRDIRVFDLAKMAVCLRRNFRLTQKEILKTSKLKPKMVILVLGMVMVPKVVICDRRLCGRRRRAAAHHHQETFDTDVLSLSGSEELELTFRGFMKARRQGR